MNDYSKSIEISRRLRVKGKPIGAIDILIASMCLNRDFELVTSDTDFKQIKVVEPNFKLKIKS